MMESYLMKLQWRKETGVTKLSNMSIFSKMNNLTDVSMRAEYASAFGYTDEELEHLHSATRMRSLRAVSRNT